MNSNIVAFPSKPSKEDLKRIVMGRSRRLALPALMSRVRELWNGAEPKVCRMLMAGREVDAVYTVARIGTVHIDYHRWGPDEGGFQPGTYFAIIDQSGQRRMTGYFYDDGTHHVMSWKRGEWQAALFG
jgi:hypothetical protein